MDERQSMTGGKAGFLRRLGTVGVVSLLAFGGLSGTVAAKPQVNTDQYELSSGSVVEWVDPWMLDERNSGFSSDAAGDIVTLTDGESQFILSTSPGLLTPEDGRDSLIGQYEDTRDDVVEIDADGDKSSAYSILTFADDDGETWGSYSSWSLSSDGQTLIGLELIALVDEVESAMEAAQGGIAVDGVTVFGDADGAEIADSIAAGKTTRAKSSTSSKSSKSSKSESKSSKSESKSSKSSSGKSSSKTGKSRTSKTSSIDPAFEDAGLIDETSYESPQYGYSVTWDDPWVINPGDEQAVISDTSSGQDSVYIATEDPTYALLSVTGLVSNGTTAAQVADTWSSQDFLDQYTGEGTEVLLADSSRKGGAVVTYGPLKSNENVDVVIVREVVSFDGGDTLVLLTLVSPADDFAEIYDSVQEAVQLDGGQSMGFFTTDEVLDELP